MDINEFIKNFEDSVEGIKKNTIKPETVIMNLKEMDSLAILSVITMIDSEYNLSITAEEFNNCSKINDLYELLSKKQCVT